MTSDDASRVGRALDRILRRIARRESYQQVLLAVREAQFDERIEAALRGVMQSVYGQAAVAGATIQAAILGASEVLSPAAIRRIQRARDAHVERAIAAYAETVTRQAGRSEAVFRALEHQAREQGADLGFFEAAIGNGARYKTWVRRGPVREPRAHTLLQGTTIPIDALYTIPDGPNAGAEVYGPHDWDRLPEPNEWINCSHGLVYATEARAADLERALRFEADAEVVANRLRFRQRRPRRQPPGRPLATT